jgi:AcrR family transcriptional regulator
MADRKTDILEAARDLLLAGGPRGVTLRKVAAKVGVSATAIYRHFASREALLYAVLREGHARFGSYLFRALEGQTPVERLERAAACYLQFALEHPAYYRAIFMVWDEPCAPPAGQTNDPGPTFRFLLDRVVEAQRAGAVKPDADPLEVSLHLWSHVHGLASLYLTGGLRFQLAEAEYLTACRRIVGWSMAGLRP